MTSFGNRRRTMADALELELTGTATESAAAEFVPLADALHRAATSLPPATSLRSRREALMGVGSAAAAHHARRRRVIRPLLLAAVLAIVVAAAALGAATVSSWLQSDPRPPAGHQPAQPASASPEDAGSSGDRPDAPGGSDLPRASGPSADAKPPSESADCGDTPPATCAEDAARPSPTVSRETPLDQSTADLLEVLNAACGDDVGLLELDGLEASTVTAPITGCEAARESPVPRSAPASELDERTAELLALLIAACDQDASLPDLTGLDNAAATALVEELVAECDAALESSVPTSPPANELDEPTAELLAILVAGCGEGATLPDLTGLDNAAAAALVQALAAECEAALTLP